MVFVISFLKEMGFTDIRFVTGSVVFSYFLLSPLSAIFLAIASIGLFKLQRWGHLLANICLFVFLFDFMFVIIDHFFPDIFGKGMEVGRGWFVFYHMDMNIETISGPMLAAILVAFINLKSVRQKIYN
jgi:hypothetical protein